MFALSLLEYPPLDVLLGIAAGSEELPRAQAMKYLLANLEDRYFKEWDSAALPNVPCIPALAADYTPFLAPPNDVSQFIFS